MKSSLKKFYTQSTAEHSTSFVLLVVVMSFISNLFSVNFFSAPINIGYTTAKQEFVFKEGYFFSVSPGYYKQNDFGIRLKNVYEVVDTGDRHYSGAKYLAFRVVTLFPFDAKLIDRTLLSQEEVNYCFIYFIVFT